MFSQIAGKASFVNYLPRLTQATSDDGEPTPGYLLDEITKITYQSVSLSHQLVDYLTHRLNKSSTPVKLKILKIVIYVVNNGHISFRQQLRLNDSSIKSALLHSGPADPLLGITLYKDVQKLAQETLDLLFDAETMKEEEGGGQTVPVESPTVFMGGMGASARGGGKYEGFGNALKDREGTVTDKMLDYFGRLIHQSDDQASEVIRAALHSSPGDYQPVAVAGALIDPVFTAELPTLKTTFIKNHVPGRAGGGWESDEDEHEELGNHKGPQPASDIEPIDPHSVVSGSLHEQNEYSLKDSVALEAQEVLNKFCKSPGLPSLDELDEVCAKFAIVGCSHIMQALPTMITEFITSLRKEGLMRILLLLEWLYLHDYTMQQVPSKDTSEILDNVVKDLNLPASCRSKAMKLKLLLEKSQNVTSDMSSVYVAAN